MFCIFLYHSSTNDYPYMYIVHMHEHVFSCVLWKMLISSKMPPACTVHVYTCTYKCSLYMCYNYACMLLNLNVIRYVHTVEPL